MRPDWEIWLDTNLSPIIAKWMAEFTGYEVKSTYSLFLQHDTDLSIYWKAKRTGNVIIISKDSDFSEIINRRGAPPKLINLKVGNCSNRLLWERLKPSIKDAINLLVAGGFNIVDFE